MSAALTDKLLKVGVAGTLTSMSSPGKALGASSFNIGSGSNYPTDTGIVVAVRTVDNDGAEVAGTYTEWLATRSGTTLTINPTPVYGNDQVYAAGSNTQVFIPVSAYAHDLLIDALLEIMTQDAALREDAAVGDRGELKELSPAGLVAPYAGSTAPNGWLLCYGQAVSRTTYADLFAAISTTYGSGDGSTTFNLPDLRGRVVAGQDDMGGSSANRLTGQTGGVDGDVLGGTGGAETHTLTEAQMPSHFHTTTAGDGTAASGGAFQAVRFDAGSSVSKATDSKGSGAAHNNVQPTAILNYIIKT